MNNIILITINKINEVINLTVKNFAKKFLFLNNKDLILPENDCKKKRVKLEIRPISAASSN
jgi:hypothetical protein